MIRRRPEAVTSGLRLLAAACVLAALGGACGSPPAVPRAAASTPPPASVTSGTTLSPGAVAGFLHPRVTGVTPILLPAAIPDQWTASVEASATTYSVSYAGSDGRQVALATIVPNPPPYVNQAHPSFRGAARTLYQWESATDPRSRRMLLWEEPGSRWPGGFTKSGAVSFYLTADGITDAEFWQVANSLNAV